MSLEDRIRFAHWTDLNELEHVGTGSDNLWNELMVLEGMEFPAPQPGEDVYVRSQTTGLVYHGKVDCMGWIGPHETVWLILDGAEPGTSSLPFRRYEIITEEEAKAADRGPEL